MHAQRDFDPVPGSPAAVRQFVCESTDVDISHPAVLVASELAANAVRHAKTPFILTIDTDGTILLGCGDLSADMPRRNSSSEYSRHGGRGLRIVDALSVRWGTAATAYGKHVWAEVAAGAEPAGSASAGMPVEDPIHE